MKVRTQFILSAVIFVVILAVGLITFAIVNLRLQQIAKQEDLARSLQQDTNDLGFITNSYLLFHDQSQLTLWQSQMDSISSELTTLQANNQQQQNLINDMKSNQQRILAVFTDIKIGITNNPSASQSLDYIGTAYSRLAVQDQVIIANANQLSLLLRNQSGQIEHLNSQFIFTLFVVFGLLIIVNFVLINRRVIRGLSILGAGAKVIGSGNLNHVVPIKSKDEIGEVSHAFNQMAADLKTVTASRAELENEIYERKKAEEEIAYRATFPDLNPNPVVELDADGSIVYINPSAKALFPNLPQQGIRHPYLTDWRAVTNEIKLDDTGYRTRDIKIGDTWYEQAISRVPSSQNFRIYGRDITERKQADKLKDEFIGMVSHELKTPLTVIIGALATATDPRITAEDARELLGDAAVHANIMANMVDNLLELSRHQSNRLVLSTKAVNIADAVQNVLKSLGSKSSIHHLVSEVPSNLSPAQADQFRLERILCNLVDNAIKYCPDGGEVKVTARQDGDLLTIGVSDQGPGISADDQARLFQSFARLGTTVKGAVQGTGLGLRVCRILAEAHGGRIWVESQKGKGSTFVFTLPAAKAQAI